MTDEIVLPVAVIGAGPVGLAAAAQLAARDQRFVVLEASSDVSASFRSTAHVRLFSPWRMNIDSAAARLLEARGWTAPEVESKPSAGELCSQYLQPLARALAPHVHFNTRVLGISKRGFDKVKSAARDAAPFVLRISVDGREQDLEARAVIDASGNWNTPNPIGVHGLLAIGEQKHADQIRYGMPDILGEERGRYANKRVLVIGSGHSAAGSLIALAELARVEGNTNIVWAVRGDNLQRILGGGAKDGLPERGKLGTILRQLTQDKLLQVITSFQAEAVSGAHGQLQVRGRIKTTAHVIDGIDQIIVATGSRPDLTIARELRLRLDPWLESPEKLAPLIDPNVHSCGSVPPHGYRELEHPEVGYYAIGAKSYGRAPNFLMATGYEQARSVVAALAGDFAAADDVQLVLPETGVCSTDFVDTPAKETCCGPPKPSASNNCCGPSAPVSKSSSCCG